MKCLSTINSTGISTAAFFISKSQGIFKIHSGKSDNIFEVDLSTSNYIWFSILSKIVDTFPATNTPAHMNNAITAISIPYLILKVPVKTVAIKFVKTAAIIAA